MPRNHPDQRLPTAHSRREEAVPVWLRLVARSVSDSEMASNARSGSGTRGKPKNMSGRGRPYRPRCACEAPSSRMNCSCASLAAERQKPPACSHPSRVVWDCSLSLSRDSQCECHGHAGRQRQPTSAVTGGGWCAFGLRRGASRRVSSCTAGGRGVDGRLSDNRPRSLPEDPVAAPCSPSGLHSPIDVGVLWLALDLGLPGNTRGTGSAASGEGREPNGRYGPWTGRCGGSKYGGGGQTHRQSKLHAENATPSIGDSPDGAPWSVATCGTMPIDPRWHVTVERGGIKIPQVCRWWRNQ